MPTSGAGQERGRRQASIQADVGGDGVARRSPVLFSGAKEHPGVALASLGRACQL